MQSDPGYFTDPTKQVYATGMHGRVIKYRQGYCDYRVSGYRVVGGTGPGVYYDIRSSPDCYYRSSIDLYKNDHVRTLKIL